MKKTTITLIHIFCAMVVVVIIAGFALMIAGICVKDEMDAAKIQKPIDYNFYETHATYSEVKITEIVAVVKGDL